MIAKIGRYFSLTEVESKKYKVEYVDKFTTTLGGIQKLRWQDKVGRWFFECQRYLITFLNKHVNQRQVGGQNGAKKGQRSFWMPPTLPSKWVKHGHILARGLHFFGLHVLLGNTSSLGKS